MTAVDALRALAAWVAPCHLAGLVPTAQTVPYSVLHPSPGTPIDRALCGTSIDREAVHRLIAVSDMPHTVLRLANLLTDAIDGHDHNGGVFFVEFVSPPLEDDQDPAGVRWSCTLEIRHHQYRS